MEGHKNFQSILFTSKVLLPPNPGYLTERRELKYLGGIDFILLSGSSNTLGAASGVTDMYGAGTDVERRYLISSWKRLSS